MDHILSLSYGKDSLACLGAIEELGWTLDRIIHAEVWATDTIPADPPPMVEFKGRADVIIKSRWGIQVEHIRAKKTYEQQFYTKYGKGQRTGWIYGRPIIRGAWCNSMLKVSTLDKAQKGGVCYIGIAIDEPGRFHNLSEKKKSPLVEAGWTEKKCHEWCEKNGLLSPIYTTATRGGCWFCPYQSIQQLRLLRKTYPEYWTLMLMWDNDSPRTFTSDGHTVHDFERRFQLEDEHLLRPDDPAFRWAMLDEPLNYMIF